MNTRLLENDFLKIKRGLMNYLDDIRYPDSGRIAREIIEFLLEIYPKADAKKISGYTQDIIYRLKEEEPWEYIRGWAEFCNYKYIVDKNVLIPRPETEDLVSFAIKDLTDLLNNEPKTKVILIDVGTGSGCIINSIALKINEISPTLSNQIDYIATDINPQSLKIAKKNSKLLETKIKYFETDLIEGLFNYIDKHHKSKIFILANLPYIPTKVCKNLDKSVLSFEPYIALDGGELGTTYYKELLEQIKKMKIEPVEMIWEIDQLIEASILDLCPNAEILNDYTSKIRFAKIIR